jgi:predicted TIM-barrel fold metal-dependent hydrolase
MPVVDADTHVDECEETWAYLQGPDAKYAPITVTASEAGIAGGVNVARNRWWLSEGNLIPRAIRDAIHHPAQAAREMSDVQVRLADMDRMGVDIQVLFPTFFIRYGNTRNPAGENALAFAYNRWLAERCAPTNGRLRWIAQVPFLDTDAAVQELHWAKEHGAVGIYKRGYDLETPVTDPRFFPIYEAAAALNLPVCIHTGHPLPGREWDRGFPLQAAFIGLVQSRVPDRFPELRWGFIEGGASWVPYCFSQLGMQHRSNMLHERAQGFELTGNVLRDNRFFIAMDPVDDIEYLVQLGAEDNLMIGTDYCHGDISANQAALDEVKAWADAERITDEVAHKILDTNPHRFYGL